MVVTFTETLTPVTPALVDRPQWQWAVMMFLCVAGEGQCVSSVPRPRVPMPQRYDIYGNRKWQVVFLRHIMFTRVSHWEQMMWSVSRSVTLSLLLFPQVMSSSTLMTSVCSAPLTPTWSNCFSRCRLVRAWPSCSVEDILCLLTPRTPTQRRAPLWLPLAWSTAPWWWTAAAATTRTWSTCRWAPSCLRRLWPRPGITPGTRI